MAVRTSMSDLITRTRRYIGDPSGANQVFQDQDVQDALDEYRHTVRYAPLIPGPTLHPGSLYDYLDYYASAQNWENDELLSWTNFATLTPITADRITAHWTFDNSQNPAGQYPPVFITGKFYDVWAAAADLLENWAAQLSTTAYAFTSDGQTFHREQIVAAKLKLAEQYRRKAMARMSRARRTDLDGPYTTFSLGMGGPGDVGGDGQQ